jgi:hypothetical protein
MDAISLEMEGTGSNEEDVRGSLATKKRKARGRAASTGAVHDRIFRDHGKERTGLFQIIRRPFVMSKKLIFELFAFDCNYCRGFYELIVENDSCTKESIQ